MSLKLGSMLVVLAAWLALAQAAERVYYIGAVEVEWNYAPSGKDLFNVNSTEFEVFSEQLIYTKAVYREFTDGNFTTVVNRSLDEVHLGILGPVISASVGDTVIVHFKNMLPFNCSLSGHGVTVSKASEGSLYQDSTTLHADDSVAPGANYTYVWNITENDGPGPNDGDSILTLYHSFTNVTRDVNSGLIGPIVISRASVSNATVDKEFYVLFYIFDEELSYYASVNINDTNSTESEGNEKYSMNGYIFGNLPGLNMSRGDSVKWYVFGLGDDLHAAHWQGNSVLYEGKRVNTVPIAPATTHVADMVAANAGTWGFYCHVSDHMDSGMEALYTVK